MMANLMEAWCDNRLRVTSSRSVFKNPDARFVDHNTLQITTADGSFNCSLSPSTVTLMVGGNIMTAVVNANSFGDNGVWIQVSCRCHGKDIFWLELYVPNTAAVAARGIAAERGSALQQLQRS
jgi:hypothetical protein